MQLEKWMLSYFDNYGFSAAESDWLSSVYYNVRGKVLQEDCLEYPFCDWSILRRFFFHPSGFFRQLSSLVKCDFYVGIGADFESVLISHKVVRHVSWGIWWVAELSLTNFFGVRHFQDCISCWQLIQWSSLSIHHLFGLIQWLLSSTLTYFWVGVHHFQVLFSCQSLVRCGTVVADVYANLFFGWCPSFEIYYSDVKVEHFEWRKCGCRDHHNKLNLLWLIQVVSVKL